MTRTPHECSFDERESGCPVCLDDELREAREGCSGIMSIGPKATGEELQRLEKRTGAKYGEHS